MGLSFRTLFSGSSGNSCLVTDGETYILVDAGVAGKKIEEALFECEIDPKKIAGILVTHEHEDHVKSVGILGRRYGLPIYSNKETLAAMKAEKILKKIPDDQIIEFSESIKIGNIQINSFNISHDTAKPIGFTFSIVNTKNNESNNQKIGFVTDTGFISEEIKQALAGSSAVLIEANHDIEMLDFGPYPFKLKTRIKSEKGHLSNSQCAELAIFLAKAGTKKFVLGHLSEQNNLPELAYETVNAAFKTEQIADYFLTVAPRNNAGEWVEA